MLRTFLAAVVATTCCFAGQAPAAAVAEPWGEADGAAHPYSGQLVRFENGEALGGCSGTLVSPTVFVTAGHCAIRKQQNPGTDLWVTFESVWTKTSPPTARYRVDYAVAATTIDLGVEVLADPVTGIAPARLAPAGTLDRLMAGTTGHPELTLVGYGQGGAPYLDPVQSWIESVRRSADVDVVRVGDMEVQTRGDASHQGGPATGCAGNSGGGLFLPGTNILTAIAALADPMCVTHGRGPRLDSPAARHFLSQFVSLA
jgi:hypothetical protein